jgi:hypothetical protein
VRKVLAKLANIKLHKNPFSCCPSPHMQLQQDTQTDTRRSWWANCIDFRCRRANSTTSMRHRSLMYLANKDTVNYNFMQRLTLKALREKQMYSSKNMIFNTEHTVRIPQVRRTSRDSPQRTGSQEHNAEMRSQEVKNCPSRGTGLQG